MEFKFIQEAGITIPIPTSYTDCLELLRSDYYRYRQKKSNFFIMFLYALKEPAFRFQLWLRLGAYKNASPLYFICKVLHRHYMFKYSLIIPTQTKIGYGLFISHPAGIIINPTAVIGNNVNISQFTTTGSNEGHAAVVGDNVYLGPSVCLVEDIRIGSNSTIGAGTIVTKDIPENSVAVGNPARVIYSTLKSGKYVGNRYPFKVE